jgi:hypothetical protein
MGINEHEFEKLMPVDSLVYISRHNKINQCSRKKIHSHVFQTNKTLN